MYNVLFEDAMSAEHKYWYYITKTKIDRLKISRKKLSIIIEKSIKFYSKSYASEFNTYILSYDTIKYLLSRLDIIFIIYKIAKTIDNNSLDDNTLEARYIATQFILNVFAIYITETEDNTEKIIKSIDYLLYALIYINVPGNRNVNSVTFKCICDIIKKRGYITSRDKKDKREFILKKLILLNTFKKNSKLLEKYKNEIENIIYRATLIFLRKS